MTKFYIKPYFFFLILITDTLTCLLSMSQIHVTEEAKGSQDRLVHFHIHSHEIINNSIHILYMSQWSIFYQWITNRDEAWLDASIKDSKKFNHCPTKHLPFSRAHVNQAQLIPGSTINTPHLHLQCHPKKSNIHKFITNMPLTITLLHWIQMQAHTVYLQQDPNCPIRVWFRIMGREFLP